MCWLYCLFLVACLIVRRRVYDDLPTRLGISQSQVLCITFVGAVKRHPTFALPRSPLLGSWPAAKSQLPRTPVVSMSQCNTGSKSTRRSFKIQGLSRPLIQTQGYFVQVGLREARQIGFLGQVLS
jgi:hypothetical protein